MTHFSTEFFRQNRQSLRKLLGNHQLVVVTAHGVLQRTADTTFPFAQERNFWYLTGIDEPDIVLVLDGAEEFVIAPPVDAVRDVFDGALDAKAVTKRSGITTVLPYAEGWNQLKASLHTHATAHTILPGPVYHQQYALYANPARRRLLERIKRLNPGLDLQDARPALTKLRSVKQPAEIAAITEAVRITTQTIDTLRQQQTLQAFANEYELEAAITAAFRRSGAHGHAYTPIVASGAHATTLHYVANDGRINPGELIVVDVGAEIENYAADITRTLCSRPLTPRQRAVADGVREVQHYAAVLIAPGLQLRDYEAAVATKMGEVLQSLGLVTSTHDTDMIRRYYPHATSHFLGLDVHDVGDYHTPLEPGMVLTCEPGIYIPEEGIGVRLEDDLVVTATGSKNLSASCSYDPSIV